MQFQEVKELIGLMIGFVAVIMGCGIPIIAVYLEYRKRKEIFMLYHQQRMAAIDKGIELPPLPEGYAEGFMGGDGKPSKPRSPDYGFGAGMIWLLTGLALTVALYFNGKGAVTLYGLIPVALGLAYLITYFAIGKKAAGTDRSAP
jgi:hypothetical protein